MKRNSNIKVYNSFKVNGNGINFFIPNDKELYKKGKPTHGFGQIKYAEGSVYTGEVYFDGTNYHKLGYGKQEFTFSGLGCVDPVINEKIYLFVGEFDYTKTNWIYGNGVLYYRDPEGNPSRFVKGFFSCLDKVAEYKGEFDYSLLVDGYSKEMESDYVKKFSLIQPELDDLKDIVTPEVLFIGDSYFEFFHYEHFAGDVFKNIYDTTKYLNIGVGGTKYSDWMELLDNITYFPKFKNIVINLGFNDLHYNKKNTPHKVFNMMVSVLNKLNTMFDNPNIYVLNVCHSPANVSLFDKEVKYNKLLNKYAKKLGITIIDNSKAIYEKNLTVNVFDDDKVHLNPIGYQIMIGEINKYL